MGDSPLWVHPVGYLGGNPVAHCLPSLSTSRRSTPTRPAHPAGYAPSHPWGINGSRGHSGVAPRPGYPRTTADDVPRSFAGLLHQPQHGSLEALLAGNLLPKPFHNLNLPILKL